MQRYRDMDTWDTGITVLQDIGLRGYLLQMEGGGSVEKIAFDNDIF